VDRHDEANSLFFLILRTCLKMCFPCPPHEGMDEVLRSFVACALDKGEWLNSRPGHFMSRMKPPVYWVGVGWTPVLVSSFWRWEKSLAPTVIWTSDHLACSPITVLNMLRWLMKHHVLT
jgi:hypothetical protein